MKRVIIIICLSVLVPLLGTEALLTIADPFGLVYFDDLSALFHAAQPDDTGYALPTGTHALKGYTYTITEDGARLTPDATADGTPVYFIGDSVTFGMGVNDDDVWVNILARDLRLNAVNLARPGYNAGNVRRLRETLPSDACVVWLTVSNDAWTDYRYTPPTSRWQSRLSLLLYTLGSRDGVSSLTYDEDMRAIMAHEPTLLLAFDDGYGAAAAEYGAVIVPMYTRVISRVDAHANAAGNVQIADGVRDAASGFVHNCRQRGG